MPDDKLWFYAKAGAIVRCWGEGGAKSGVLCDRQHGESDFILFFLLFFFWVTG